MYACMHVCMYVALYVVMYVTGSTHKLHYSVFPSLDGHNNRLDITTLTTMYIGLRWENILISYVVFFNSNDDTVIECFRISRKPTHVSSPVMNERCPASSRLSACKELIVEICSISSASMRDTAFQNVRDVQRVK